MKTAKKYFQESYENVNENAVLTIPAKNLFRIMEGYATYKVNELNKSDVIKSVCGNCGGKLVNTNMMGGRICSVCGRNEQTVL